MPAKITIEKFVERAKRIHSNAYDYSNTTYVNNTTKLEIMCPEHGPFFVIPKRHLNEGQGCPICGLSAIRMRERISSSRKTHDHFLADATRTHGERYDYSLCNYVGGKIKLPIICRQHGIFHQHAENHINGKQGCPKCYDASRIGRKGVSGYSIQFFQDNPEKKNQPAILYIAKLQSGNDTFLKIGITAKDSLKSRYYYHSKRELKITSIMERQTTLYDAFLEEAKLLSVLKPYRFYPNRKFSGYTECVKMNREVILFLEEYFRINIQDLLETK